MDNARPHTAVTNPQYLAAMGRRLVYQSPYSPDLNLFDRFLFIRVKEVVRPVQYDSKDEVVKAAQHCLRSLPADYLIHEFHKFLGNCRNLCIFYVTRYFIAYYHSF